MSSQPASQTPTDVAELVGLLMETALCGILLVLTIVTLYILLDSRNSRSRSLNWPMLSASLAMLSLSIAHLAVNACRVSHAFLHLDKGQPRLAYLGAVNIPLYTAKYSLFFTMLVLGDIMVIYRCYLVWQNSIYVVLLPILLSTASAILAYMAIWATTHYPQHPTAVFIVKYAHPWGSALFSLSLVANIYATGGIAYRIWSYERQSLKAQQEHSYTAYRRSLAPIAKIIVESGALNATFLVIYTGILDRRTLAVSLMGDIAAPFIGIVFSLVIVRVALDAKRESGISHSESTLSTFAAKPGIRGTGTSASAFGDISTRPTTVLGFESENSYHIRAADVELGELTYKVPADSETDFHVTRGRGGLRG